MPISHGKFQHWNLAKLPKIALVSVLSCHWTQISFLLDVTKARADCCKLPFQRDSSTKTERPPIYCLPLGQTTLEFHGGTQLHPVPIQWKKKNLRSYELPFIRRVTLHASGTCRAPPGSEATVNILAKNMVFVDRLCCWGFQTCGWHQPVVDKTCYIFLPLSDIWVHGHRALLLFWH